MTKPNDEQQRNGMLPQQPDDKPYKYSISDTAEDKPSTPKVDSDEAVEQLARELFGVHHFKGQYKVNLSWETCSLDIKEWWRKTASYLVRNGYTRHPSPRAGLSRNELRSAISVAILDCVHLGSCVYDAECHEHPEMVDRITEEIWPLLDAQPKDDGK